MTRGNIVEQGLFFGETARAREPSLFEDRVVLGEMFYREIMEHGVPLLDRAIRELRDRSMAIDVYVWLAYKLHVLQARTPLRWPALYAQFGAGFASIKNFPALLPRCPGGGDRGLSGCRGEAGGRGDRAVPLGAADFLPERRPAALAAGWLTPHHFLRVSESLRKSVAPQAPMAG